MYPCFLLYSSPTRLALLDSLAYCLNYDSQDYWINRMLPTDATLVCTGYIRSKDLQDAARWRYTLIVAVCNRDAICS